MRTAEGGLYPWCRATAPSSTSVEYRWSRHGRPGPPTALRAVGGRELLYPRTKAPPSRGDDTQESSGRRRSRPLVPTSRRTRIRLRAGKAAEEGLQGARRPCRCPPEPGVGRVERGCTPVQISEPGILIETERSAHGVKVLQHHPAERNPQPKTAVDDDDEHVAERNDTEDNTWSLRLTGATLRSKLHVNQLFPF